MKNNTAHRTRPIVGFIVVSLLGTLLHFLYDWTESPVASLISGVNESTWEHMKLLFFPLLLVALVQSAYDAREYANYWCIKLKSTLMGLLLIPTVFYTLRGIFGTTPDFVNIAIFFVAAAAVFWYEFCAFEKGTKPCAWSKWAVVFLCVIAAAFWFFTFNPPAIPLFQDPLDGHYGLHR